MKKSNYIVYNYKQRSDVIEKNKIEALNEVWKYVYPTPDKTFDEFVDEYQKKKVETGNETNDNFRISYCDGKYNWPLDFYYIPEKVLKELWDNRRESYGIVLHWEEDMNALINFLFDKPGFKEVYSPTEWSNGEDVRHGEDVPLLKDVIGKEASDKVKTMLEDYKRTFKWGLIEVNQFGGGYFSTPYSNREHVESAWKEAFGIDIKIPDDDKWIDEYEFSDMVYEGKFEDENSGE